MRYAPDTAGGIMSDRFIALRDEMAVEQARELLRAHAQEERTEEIAYLYVTDAGLRLVGIVSLRDLVFRRAERRMSEIMNRDVKFVRVRTTRRPSPGSSSIIITWACRCSDKEGRLVGVVKASDALEVARRRRPRTCS